MSGVGVYKLRYLAFAIHSDDKYYTNETTTYYHPSSDKHVVILAEQSIMLGLCNAKGE